MTRMSDLFKHPALREIADSVKNADLRAIADRLRNADLREVADRLKAADPLQISDLLARADARPRDTRTTAAVAAVAAATVISVATLGAVTAVTAPSDTTGTSAAMGSQTAHRATGTAKTAAQLAKSASLTKTAKAAKALHLGKTTASYFWDDASGRAGDTGMPAIGKPMQRGLAASPSWPLGTEGYVTYKGKTAKFFIGDRGPGKPSDHGVMLDLDAKTFADLTKGVFDPDTLTVKDNGGAGHIQITYKITKWGPGVGKKGAPEPFSTGAWND
ncbi:hypothetical protein Aph01nite_69210 [Acrocarpospora phusangensis]|uniref:Uncharacterized protein n=1 Tax=Acrocarpospora phusangensis TaxID=1070424 RepID=A0A919QIS8_9ACTN|nr:hypothetical protein [Acrocarpospora phusangensis]GIH28611.1 hypothetical protein Aph01nite_69210 [Acrocarpospora phusangensis]